MSRGGASSYARALTCNKKKEMPRATSPTRNACNNKTRSSCSVDFVSCLVHARNSLSKQQQRASKKVHCSINLKANTCINLKANTCVNLKANTCINLKANAFINLKASSCSSGGVQKAQELSTRSCSRVYERCCKAVLESMRSSGGRVQLAASFAGALHGRSICCSVRPASGGGVDASIGSSSVRQRRASSAAHASLYMGGGATSMPAYPGAVADCIHFLKASTADL